MQWKKLTFLYINTRTTTSLLQCLLLMQTLHVCPLDRSSEKKFPPEFLFWFLLHMTPRLWEDVLELQKQAKLKDNVVFSTQGDLKKSLGTFFHVKLKNKLGPPSSLHWIFKAKKSQNWKKKWRKQTQFYMNVCPQTFFEDPLGWENDIIF